MDVPDPDPDASRALAWLRRYLLALLVLGLAGTGGELVLLRHYESWLQLIPLAAIGWALVLAAWNAWRPSRAGVRVLRATMAAFLATGGLGVWLHYRANAEFQLDMDPSLHGWTLLDKTMHSQAPPALAPGAMAELGLLGLAYAFRHPALSGPQFAPEKRGA